MDTCGRAAGANAHVSTGKWVERQEDEDEEDVLVEDRDVTKWTVVSKIVTDWVSAQLFTSHVALATWELSFACQAG